MGILFEVEEFLPGPFAVGVIESFLPLRVIAVRDDLSTDETEAVILHELTHAWERLHHKQDSPESFALEMERHLFAKWCHVRRHTYPWKYAA